MIKKGRLGSSFNDFLKEEGIYEEVQVQALKEVTACQLAQAMKATKRIQPKRTTP